MDHRAEIREFLTSRRAGIAPEQAGIAIHASFLPHDDPDASLAFHRDTLGFGGMRWITAPLTSPAGRFPGFHPRLQE